MFELMNVHNNVPLAFKISHSGREVVFDIGSIINKRNKEDLKDDVQVRLINSYLDYKGDEFKSKLMDAYLNAEDIIINSIVTPELRPLPYSMIPPIIDMFDLMDVFHYIKNVYGIQAPSSLSAVFDTAIEADGRGTRVQTFIIDEYYELAAAALVMKTVLGPLGHYAHVKNNDINGVHKEYIIFSILEGTHLMETPAVVKVKGLIGKLLEVAMRDEAVKSVYIIEKQISSNLFSDYILATVMLQKVAIASIVNDNAAENIITKIYNYTVNKLRTRGDNGNKINDKRSLVDNETGDSESIIESYRVVSDLSPGTVVELDWVGSDVNKLIKNFSIPLDEKHVLQGINYGYKVLTTLLAEEQKEILGVIFKDMIDPRGLDSLSKDSIVNLIGVAYAYCYSIGFEDIGNILISSRVVETENIMTINTNVNKVKVPQEVKDQLDTIYPYRRVINKTKTVNVAEERINELSNTLSNMKWYCMDKNINPGDVIRNDIKLRLTEFIIKNEGMKYVQ